jgi:hypothetical protein
VATFRYQERPHLKKEGNVPLSRKAAAKDAGISERQGARSDLGTLAALSRKAAAKDANCLFPRPVKVVQLAPLSRRSSGIPASCSRASALL